MRTWGRVGQVNGIGGTWVEVSTTPAGSNDLVWLLTLIQTLRLNKSESPTYGNYGISAESSVQTQMPPDYDAAQTQQQFASYFASLAISRVPGSSPPFYDVVVVSHAGVVLESLPT